MRILAKPAFIARKKNPYTWSLYQELRNNGNQVDEFSAQRCLTVHYDIFHIHWPEQYLSRTNPYLAAVLTWSLLFFIDALRFKGTKIVWTVHNLAAHEQKHPKLEGLFWKQFIQKLDGYISLSHAGKEAAIKRFPRLASISGHIVPHSHYRGIYPDEITREVAREHLDVPDSTTVLLFFGKIRAYKNIPALLEQFQILESKNILLYITGRPSPDSTELMQHIQHEAALNPNIRVHDTFIPDENVQTYFQASDLVVLPYREILNSGSALLALSFNRPILVPNRGSLAELQKEVGHQWVKTYSGDISVGDLKDAIEWAKQMTRTNTAPLNDLDPKAIAIKTQKAYSSICGLSE